MSEARSRKPPQSVPVYASDALTVVNGANLGDELCFASELVADDIYGLSPLARPQRLSLTVDQPSVFTIAEGTEVGRVGAALHLDCCLTFMTGDGETTQCLVLVEVDGDGNAAAVYALPMAPLHSDQDYALVTIDRDTAARTFAQLACVSFTRGTNITLSSGAQMPIEELRVGDAVLTRDDGPQKIRWIGQTTTRAVGAFAPIVITAGTLHNENDLIVSPDHRLFIYQRHDHLGAGRSELLVKARHLVNGITVFARKGGFVDDYQLLFDSHQIIYAEGIAAESLLVDTRTQPALPADLAKKLTLDPPGHANQPHSAYEVGEKLLQRPDAADLLRRSSGR